MSILLPPSGVMMLPKFTKHSVKGRSLLLTLMGACVAVFMVITADFFWLIRRPTWESQSVRLVLHMLVGVRDQCQVIGKVQIFKCGEDRPSDAGMSCLCCASHHPVNDKIEEYCRHHTALPDTGRHFKPNATSTHTTVVVVVETLDEFHHAMWDSISPQDAPQAVSVYTIKSFLKVYEIHMELTLPFRTLFYDVSLRKNPFCTAPAFSESCLFISQCCINCRRYSAYDHFGEDLAGD